MPNRSEPGGALTGLTCPRCGGGIWESDVANVLAFECRIGHTLSLPAMLAEHGAARRQKVSAAGRMLAEAAALNRRVARWARDHGHELAATSLDDEAAELDSRSAELVRLAASALQSVVRDA